MPGRRERRGRGRRERRERGRDAWAWTVRPGRARNIGQVAIADQRGLLLDRAPASSVRLATPSLANARERCTLTVLRETNRRSPISGLVRPSAARSATRDSTGVSASQPVAGRSRDPRARRAYAIASSNG